MDTKRSFIEKLSTEGYAFLKQSTDGRNLVECHWPCEGCILHKYNSIEYISSSCVEVATTLLKDAEAMGLLIQIDKDFTVSHEDIGLIKRVINENAASSACGKYMTKSCATCPVQRYDRYHMGIPGTCASVAALMLRRIDSILEATILGESI